MCMDGVGKEGSFQTSTIPLASFFTSISEHSRTLKMVNQIGTKQHPKTRGIHSFINLSIHLISIKLSAYYVADIVPDREGQHRKI